MNTVRSEKDSMGAIDVPGRSQLFGRHNLQRSLEHFRISTEKNAHLTDSMRWR